MCGIAGSINCFINKEDLDLIRHRGPDAQSLVRVELSEDFIHLGHTRLSILDLSESGSQPMYSDCKNYIIIFNGEIYNHAQLRNRIRNVSFRGHSDTETILYYLREFGITGVRDFNGIFAFAFVDLLNEKVFLVRDHIGVKPLYYFVSGRKILFGSELKIIKNNFEYEKELDLSALNNFITFRFNPSPETLFKGIKKLPAASIFEYSKGKISIEKYWSKAQKINKDISEQDAVAEYKNLLTQAVKRQLLSDVPLGILLSGGLDSAVIGYLMAENTTEKISSFTIGFEGEGDFNELRDARLTAEFLGTNHHSVCMGQEEYMNYFHQSFYHTEEPIAEPTIPALFKVSQLASHHVKVVLSGQGADEPLAGYNRYRGEKLLADNHHLLSMLPGSILQNLFPFNSTMDRALYSARFRDPLERFIAIYTLFTPEIKQNLFKPEFLEIISQNQKWLFEEHYNMTDSGADSLSKLLYMDLRVMLPDNLLLFNDKITMANSIENRVPFLDVDLVSFIESLPTKFKLNRSVGKYIHKKAAEDWLPKSIIYRKKRAFSTPVNDWFKDQMSSSLIDLIEDPNSISALYFNRAFIRQMITLNKNRKRNFQKHLFIIYSLELWYQKFFSGNERKALKKF